MSARERRARQATWVIIVTLGVFCVLSAIIRSALVGNLGVVVALLEAGGAWFRERVEQHHARPRNAVNDHMGTL